MALKRSQGIFCTESRSFSDLGNHCASHMHPPPKEWKIKTIWTIGRWFVALLIWLLTAPRHLFSSPCFCSSVAPLPTTCFQACPFKSSGIQTLNFWSCGARLAENDWLFPIRLLSWNHCRAGGCKHRQQKDLPCSTGNLLGQIRAALLPSAHSATVTNSPHPQNKY